MNNQEQYEQEKRARDQENLSRERTKNTKKVFKHIAVWLSVLIGLGLVVWGIIFLVQHYDASAVSNAVSIPNVIAPDDQVKGNKNAKVVIYEYADFQCPACAFYSPVLNKLAAGFGDKIALVYRYFPLPMHSNAVPMAHAVEAASRQGKFWEMHDLVFAEQTKWESQKDITATVTNYAKSLGLDTTKFLSDFNSQSVKDRVDRDFNYGNDINIAYTPTFLINGKQIENPQSYDDFSKVINQALDANK